MTDFIDRFGAQLMVVNRTLAAGQPVARERRRWYRQRAAVVALAATLVTGSALAATQPWIPLLGRPALHDVPGTAATSRVPDVQAEMLGVLRRPQDASDRDRDVERLLQNLGTEQSGVRVRSIRKLGSSSGLEAVLVSVERERALSPGEATEANPLCLLIEDGGLCGTTDDLQTGHLLVLAGPHVYGLVPDGVASVELSFPNGPTRRVTVKDNFFALAETPTVQRTLGGGNGASPPPLVMSGRPDIHWLDDNGNVVGPRATP
jgi:hypothetical protein